MKKYYIIWNRIVIYWILHWRKKNTVETAKNDSLSIKAIVYRVCSRRIFSKKKEEKPPTNIVRRTKFSILCTNEKKPDENNIWICFRHLRPHHNNNRISSWTLNERERNYVEILGHSIDVVNFVVSWCEFKTLWK